VTDLANPRLSAWESFYVIVGSSGAALIGVQFVVITLVAWMRRRPEPTTISAFATPTVVHFAGALLVSAIMSAPWPLLALPSVALAIWGLGGLVYGATVILRTRRQTGYRPVREDWLWYAILPCTAYTALALGAAFLTARPEVALIVIAGTALAMLLIGIHNAWDSVTHIVALGGQEDSTTKPE
jgi:hypothetical protein